MCEGVLTGLIEADTPGAYRFTRQGEVLRCPWHGWEFDIRTGKSWCDPAHVGLREYPTGIVPGRAVTEGPQPRRACRP